MLIEELWNTEKFDINTFNQLSDNQKLQVNKYVMKTSLMKSKWYLELIKNDDVLLWYYRGQYPKPKKIINLFRKVLKMKEEEIRQVGFKLSAIRKVFYFRMAHTFGKIGKIFKRKKRK